MLKGSCGTSCIGEACRPGVNLLRAVAGRPVVFVPREVRKQILAACVSAVVATFNFSSSSAAERAPLINAPRTSAAQVVHADFGRQTPTPVVRRFGDWVVQSGDHHGLPFVIVDKATAKAYAFTPEGRLRGAAPVLLGLARGDDSVPGIGERELSDMPPEVRTTPAGRFIAELGRNASGKEVLWVDYENAVSMHRVIDTNPAERRPHRLATPTPADNRISFGCINVPIKFFDDVISPSFEGTNGIVYVLPEVHPLRKVFANYRDPGSITMSSSASLRGASPSAGSE
jgi:hypothetical protein